MKIEIDKEKFSRREWFFSIALIMMIEYWIISISYRFVDYQQVVNFISFGASIASILLAVVAIIHGFIQSDSSSKTSAKLHSQADEIKESTNTLNTSTKIIENHIEKVTTITARLDSLDTNIRNSIDKVTGLQSTVDGMHQDYKEFLRAAAQKESHNPAASPSKNESIDKTELMRVILRATSYEADLLGYALYKYSESGESLSLMEFYDKYYAVASEDISRKIVFLNLTFNLCNVLRSVNGLQYNSSSEPLIVTDSLKSLLPSYAQKTKESTIDTIVEGVRRIDEAAAKLKN